MLVEYLSLADSKQPHSYRIDQFW